MVEERKIIENIPVGSGSILLDYFQELVNNQQDMPPEFLEIVNKNFWDLLYTDKK